LVEKKKFGAEMFGMFNPMSAVTSKSKKIWKIWIPPNPKIMSKPPPFLVTCVLRDFLFDDIYDHKNPKFTLMNNGNFCATTFSITTFIVMTPIIIILFETHSIMTKHYDYAQHNRKE
jgi:hypothetical protein